MNSVLFCVTYCLEPYHYPFNTLLYNLLPQHLKCKQMSSPLILKN